jgi:hypothetical protein
VHAPGEVDDEHDVHPAWLGDGDASDASDVSDGRPKADCKGAPLVVDGVPRRDLDEFDGRREECVRRLFGRGAT